MRRAAVVLALSLTAAAHAGPIRIPGESLPPAIRSLGAIDGVTALALSADASLAAAAALDPEGKQASTVRLADAAATRGEIPVRGVVLALAFSADGTELFVVADRRSKRSIGETFLARVDTTTLKSIREIVLPRDARDVVLQDDHTLLVASDDELRTFALPAFTSGPLYRLDGANRAIVAVPGTRQVVVGREDGLWLVDLGDPQTRDGLPVRGRVPSAAPVADLVVAPDGEAGFARLTDGSVWRFRVRPLAVLGPEGSATWIGWLPEPGEEAAPAPVPVAPAPVVETPPPPPPPAPVVETQKVEPAKVETPKVETPAPPPPPAPVVEPKKVEPPKVEAPPPPPVVPGEARMEGRITGAARGAVVAVVVFGPDNILREAARVTPDGNGSWFVRELAPGTYRVLLDAGGGKVLETNPLFRTVVVAAEGTVSVAPIEAIRIR